MRGGAEWPREATRRLGEWVAAALRGVLRAESACATLITVGRAFAQTRKWQAAGTAFAGAIEDTIATRPRSL